MTAPAATLVVPDYMQAFYDAWRERNPAPPAAFCHGCGVELNTWARDRDHDYCSRTCRESSA